MDVKRIEELFRFTSINASYPGSDTGLFEMEPTAECQKKLASHGCFFRETEKGFMIAAQVIEESGKYKMYQPFIDGMKLSFAVFVTQPDFFEHAELPYDAPGEFVYYFNNLDETKPRTSLLLSSDGVKETVKEKLGEKRISFEYEEGKTAQVTDCKGNILLETEYDVEIDKIKNLYIVNLSRQEDGYFTITYNDSSVSQYCTKASFIRRNPLAIVEFYIGSDVPADYQIIKIENGNQYLEPKQFGNRYGVFSKYWRYKIKPVKIPYGTRVRIGSNNPDYTFEPQMIRFTNNDPVIFTSNELINLEGKDLEVSLYRVKCSNYSKCGKHPKYYYCNQYYGIWIDSILKCRLCKTVNGKKVYKDSCPVKFTDSFIGRLPEPQEVNTVYYEEEGKQIAQMVVWFYKDHGKYYISLTEPDFGHDDDDDDDDD